jgi:hypothetical protein
MATFCCASCGQAFEAAGGPAGVPLVCPHCKAEIAAPALAIAAGCVVGGYRIEKHVGGGGFGEVYLATQLFMDRRVALKILSPAITGTPDLVAAFVREARVLAKLEHPNIVTVFDAGEDHGVYYLATSFVEGEDVASWIARKGAIAEKEALRIALKVAEILDRAWTVHGVIHHDIKPSNIMIDLSGEIRLLDMGLSQQLYPDAQDPETEIFVGSPNYVAPEHAKGQKASDVRADIYALGATLYHMLGGVPPYADASPEDILTKHIFEPLPSVRAANPAVSIAAAKLVAAMTAKEVHQRPLRWSEVIDDIKRLVGVPRAKATPAILPPRMTAAAVKPARARPPLPHEPAADPPARPPRRIPWALIVFLVGFVAVAIVMARLMLKARAQQATEEDARREAAFHKQAQEAEFLRHLESLSSSIQARVSAEPPALDAARQELAALRATLSDAPAVASSWTERLRKFDEEIDAKQRANDEAARARELQVEADRQAQAAAAKAREEFLAEKPELLSQAAGAVLAERFSDARTVLENALRRFPFEEAAVELKALEGEIQGIANMREQILASFKRDIDAERSIALRHGTEKLKIVAVDGPVIRAEKVMRDGTRVMGSTARNVRYDDLAPAELFRRLGSEETSARNLMRGLVLSQGGAPEKACEFFKKSASPLGEALAARAAANTAQARPASPKGGGAQAEGPDLAKSTLAEGLLLYLPLDEPESGHYADLSTGRSSFSAAGTPASVEGTVGRAVELDGHQNALTSAADAVTDSPANSISLWFRTDSPEQNQQLFSAEGIFVVQLANGSLRVWMDGTGYDSPPVADALNDNKWHHVAVVNDGGRTSVFVDGAAPTVVAEARGKLESRSAPVTIGAAYDLSCCFFKGLIDEVAVWGRALGQNEVSELFKCGKANKGIPTTGAPRPPAGP